jgi:hypothetical protein
MTTAPLPDPPALAAARRKARAAVRLDEARSRVLDARESLSPVEGQGYADVWRDLADLADSIETMTRRLRALPPPTGIFEF